MTLEEENIHGEYREMKAFEKEIQLYRRFLKKEDLFELDRLILVNKKEWQMSQSLGLIEHD